MCKRRGYQGDTIEVTLSSPDWARMRSICLFKIFIQINHLSECSSPNPHHHLHTIANIFHYKKTLKIEIIHVDSKLQ